MEKQSAPTPPIPVPPAPPQSQSNPPTDPPVVPKRKVKKLFIIILVLFSLSVSGATAYLVYQNYQLKNKTPESQPTPVPVATETPSPSPTQTPSPSPTKKGDCESNDQCPEGYYCEMKSNFLDLNDPGTDIYGECVKKAAECAQEGESANWVQGINCCEGLSPIPYSFPTSDSSSPNCITSRGGSGAGICAKCGNGTCGAGENVCNCPEDCE